MQDAEDPAAAATDGHARTGVRGLSRFGCDRRGAAAVEYGLLLSLIALVVVVGVRQIGVDIGAILTRVSDAVTQAGS